MTDLCVSTPITYITWWYKFPIFFVLRRVMKVIVIDSYVQSFAQFFYVKPWIYARWRIEKYWRRKILLVFPCILPPFYTSLTKHIDAFKWYDEIQVCVKYTALACLSCSSIGWAISPFRVLRMNLCQRIVNISKSSYKPWNVFREDNAFTFTPIHNWFDKKSFDDWTFGAYGKQIHLLRRY